MQRSNRTSLLAIATLLVVSGRGFAQEENSWRPNSPAAGAKADTVGAQPAFGAVPPAPGLPQANASPPAADEGSRGWMVTSPLANVSWPEVKMPKLHWKPGWGGGSGADAAGAPIAGPLDKVRTMTQGAAQRTRSAWNKTVERLKWRGDAGGGQPGFFARMFSPSPPEPGPQTVPEFLAQERPGTVRR